MNVTIRDSQILKTVTPDVLQAHLHKTGWHETGRIYNDSGAIWRLTKNSSSEYEILLPLQQNLGDYAARISDAIKTLQEVESRSQIDILSELITNYPNLTIKGVVIQIKTPNSDTLIVEITLLGVVFDKMQEIKIELPSHNYVSAVKAYQERLPVVCTGDLIKENNTFVLKNPRDFQIDNI